MHASKFLLHLLKSINCRLLDQSNQDEYHTIR